MTQKLVTANAAGMTLRALPHDIWVEDQGVPVHRGYYVEDLRTVEVGWWKARECNAAFIELEGMRGIVEVRVTEIPAGESLRPHKQAGIRRGGLRAARARDFDDLVRRRQGPEELRVAAAQHVRHPSPLPIISS